VSAAALLEVGERPAGQQEASFDDRAVDLLLNCCFVDASGGCELPLLAPRR
jgi:hypothetical protein